MSSNKKICILGLGYIGLPTAAVIANSGQSVWGVDINREVVEIVNSGSIHIVEPGLSEVVKNAVKSGMLKAGTAPMPCDVYIVVVPTPFTHNYEPDITFVETATRMAIPLLKEGDLYILESTSPVGTTEKMAELIKQSRPDLIGKIGIAYCPERVLPGNILHELTNNDRIVGGIDEQSTELASLFYSTFVKGTVHKTNAKTAEMCKLVENSSRDVQIAFANELSLICDKAGIDVWELIRLANKHPRVKILRPGSGVGGHCIAVDPYFITADFPREAQLIAKAREINNYKAFWCAEKVKDAVLNFEIKYSKKPIVALMGLAFKPDIDDLRESPAMYIVQKIIQVGNCDCLICEPNIKEHKMYKIVDYHYAYNKADIVVFLVAHNVFKELPPRDCTVVLDFCDVRGSIKN